MFLKAISGLSDIKNRFKNGASVARHFGCSLLIILIKDPGIGILLPAPGFPQTLPFDSYWKDFLQRAEKAEFHHGTLSYPDTSQQVPATGIKGPDGSLALLFDGHPNRVEVQALIDSLPLLVCLFTREQEVLSARTTALVAESSALKAETLIRTIDAMRLKLKEALVKQEKDKRAIEELLNKKDTFMNTASHELKTPMTSLRGYLQLMCNTDMDKARSALFLQKANRQADKMINLIADLLDISKMQSGKIAFTFSEFILTDLVQEVVKDIQLINPDHHISLTYDVHAKVVADRARIEQVIINLLTNAIKYSPEANQISLLVTTSDGQITVEVKDSGIGIDEDQIGFIFDRFYRSEKAELHYSGLGLGLYISKEIIVRHGGDIGVRSTPSEGSTFWFSLPVVKGEEESAKLIADSDTRYSSLVRHSGDV